MDRVKMLINNTLMDKFKELFCNQFLQCKSELRGSCPQDEWDSKYECDFASHRLEFLNSFINRHLEVHRNSGKHAIKVTDAVEKFSCPLCQTPHREGAYSVRPYLSLCVKFLEMSIQIRNQTCQKHQKFIRHRLGSAPMWIILVALTVPVIKQ